MPVTRKRMFKPAAADGKTKTEATDAAETSTEDTTTADTSTPTNSSSVVIDLEMTEDDEDQAQEPESSEGVSTEICNEAQDEVVQAEEASGDDVVADDDGEADNDETATRGEETADVEMAGEVDEQTENIPDADKEVTDEVKEEVEAKVEDEAEMEVKKEEEPVKQEEEVKAEKMEEDDDEEGIEVGTDKEDQIPYPESIKKLRQLTVNIGPIKQRDLLSDDLHSILNMSWNCEIRFEFKEGVTKAERPGFVKIPFVVDTPGMLVKIANRLGNLHIDGRDMSVKFPEVFNNAVKDCKEFLDKKAEQLRRQVVLHHFPQDVGEETLKTMFPEARVTMNRAVAFDGSPYIKSARLEFETEQATTDFLDANKHVQIGDKRILLSRGRQPVNKDIKGKDAQGDKRTRSDKARRAELFKRQIIVHNVPKDVQKDTIKSMFPQAIEVTLNMNTMSGEAAYVKSARLTFRSEKDAVEFLHQQSKKDHDIGGCKIRLMRVNMRDSNIPSGKTAGKSSPGTTGNKVKMGTFFGKAQGMATGGQFAGRPNSEGAKKKGQGQVGAKSGRGQFGTPKGRGAWGQKQGGGQANRGAGGQNKGMRSPRGQGQSQGRHSMSPQGRSGGNQRNRRSSSGQGQLWQANQFQQQQLQMSPQQQMMANQAFAGQQASNRRQSGAGEEDPIQMMAYLKNTLARMEEKISMQSGGGGGADYGYSLDRGMGMQKQSRRKRKSQQDQRDYGTKRQFSTSYDGGYDMKLPQQSSFTTSATSSFMDDGQSSMGGQGYRTMLGQGQKITSLQGQRNMGGQGMKTMGGLSQKSMGGQISPRATSTGQMGMMGQMGFVGQQSPGVGQMQGNMGSPGLMDTFVQQSPMGMQGNMSGQMGYGNSGNMW